MNELKLFGLTLCFLAAISMIASCGSVDSPSSMHHHGHAKKSERASE